MPLIIDLKVIPSSGKQKCILDKSGQLKCYLKNPPERGLANNELIKFFADSIGVTKDQIEIVSGLSGRKKKIKINKNISYSELLEFFDIVQQQSFNFKE